MAATSESTQSPVTRVVDLRPHQDVGAFIYSLGMTLRATGPDDILVIDLCDEETGSEQQRIDKGPVEGGIAIVGFESSWLRVLHVSLPRSSHNRLASNPPKDQVQSQGSARTSTTPPAPASPNLAPLSAAETTELHHLSQRVCAFHFGTTASTLPVLTAASSVVRGDGDILPMLQKQRLLTKLRRWELDCFRAESIAKHMGWEMTDPARAEEWALPNGIRETKEAENAGALIWTEFRYDLHIARWSRAPGEHELPLHLRVPSFEMWPGFYRLRLLRDVAHLIFLPFVTLSLILRAQGLRMSWLLSIPVYLSFILCWSIARYHLRALYHARLANQLGAQHIRRVVGKWPGNVDVLLRMMRAFKTSYVLDVYARLFEEYQCTTLNLRILWMDTIITMDQQHSKFVLATGFENFWRGYNQKERMETFLGRGIFNRDDEVWKMHRTIARPFFAREKISEFEIFEKYSRRTLSLISRLSANDQPCEAQDLFSRLTIDAASEFLFGTDLQTLSAALPVPGKTAMGPKGSATDDSWGAFANAFEMAQQVVTNRGRIGYLWPLFELFKDKNAENVAVIQEWLDPLVQQAVEEKHRLKRLGITSPVAEKTFLQHLADSTDDLALIRDQLLSVLLASRDTTACLLTYVVYFIAIYPEVGKKLRAEVLEHCGPDRAPTFENIRDMKYLRAVINEVLRLFPPIPLNVRESRANACTLPPSDNTYASDDPRPFYMPGGTTIMYLPLLTQRNPALWGSDADVFDPERWLQPERIAKFVANPAMYAPFSAGPRICIGQNYAFNEASYFLVRLLQRFDTFTLAPEVQPPGSLPPPEWKTRRGRQAVEQVWPAAAMTLFVKGGMWVRFGRSEAEAGAV
ncbi:Cytochrome P450 [Mycena chlorophos]|uniref:Cytochrome P450 n=1 Tax=Mycena chlorophos TaxID=658473 RepID=A0A8H6S0P4_MYCCL|nr:Cytochrome P450 [Mycena chlorophos]